MSFSYEEPTRDPYNSELFDDWVDVLWKKKRKVKQAELPKPVAERLIIFMAGGEHDPLWDKLGEVIEEDIPGLTIERGCSIKS